MQNDLLQDLNLAGVIWELDDVPFVLRQNAVAPAAAPRAQVSAPHSIMPKAAPTAPRAPVTVVPPISPIVSMTVETAQSMASRPSDMAALQRMISGFNHPLRGGATNTILPHVGTNNSGLLLITDIPSGDDDASGELLSGAAGELLDKMLMAIGLSRDDVSALPLVFWRTPGGRTPTRAELDLSRPFVDRAIEFIAPRIILTLGTLPASELAGASLPAQHGAVTTLSDGIKCVSMFHPNYLMLKPAAKRAAWEVLQNVEKMLKTDKI